MPKACNSRMVIKCVGVGLRPPAARWAGGRGGGGIRRGNAADVRPRAAGGWVGLGGKRAVRAGAGGRGKAADVRPRSHWSLGGGWVWGGCRL